MAQILTQVVDWHLSATVAASTVSAILASLLWLLVSKSRSYQSAGLPPGPKPSWIVGNRNQVPKEKPWLWFLQLNQLYGDVVFLRMGRTPTVILGSAQAAWDLLGELVPI
jgi:hypothetical protein